MLLGRKRVIALALRNDGARRCLFRPCRRALRRAASWEFRRARRSAFWTRIFLPPPFAESNPFSAATSAIRSLALASSLFFFASPISFDAALRRACAPSAFWMAARRVSSSAINRCACGGSPRRAKPRSKASGFSRMKRISCMTVSIASCPALCRPSTSSIWVNRQDVDGRDKAGHDESISANNTPSSLRRLGGSGRCGRGCRRRVRRRAVSPQCAPTRSSPRIAPRAAARATSGSDIRRGQHRGDDEGADDEIAALRLELG